MAKISDVVRNKGKLKYATRYHNRCGLCGRARSYIGKFGLCRICFRELANKGELPGVVRASW